MRINKKKLDRAQVAVAEFRKLQPVLTAYAKNLTGRKDVRVQMSSGTLRTDGKTIYMSPSLNMADMALVRHDKSICDTRDQTTYELYCRACAAREDIMATVYHEIAHIAFDSFAEVQTGDAHTALAMMEEFAPAWYVDRQAEAFADGGYVFKHGFLELASKVNPYLQALQNGLEDVRINSRMADARPGTRIMMKSMIYALALKGVEQKNADGHTVYVKWPEYEPNLQATIASFCVASGYETDGWFGPEVTAAMADPEVSAILESVEDLQSTGEVFRTSFRAFMRLRDLGFFRLVDEEPDPEPEESNSDRPEASSDADDGGDSTDGDAGTGGEGGSDSSSTGEGTDNGASDNGGSGGSGCDGQSSSTDDSKRSAGNADGESQSSSGDDSGSGESDSRGNEPADDATGCSGDERDETGSPEASSAEVAGDSESERDNKNAYDESSGSRAHEFEGDMDVSEDEGAKGSDSDGLDATPLDYKPTEAVDATEGKVETIVPTVRKGQNISLVEMGLHRTEAPVGSGDEKAMEAAVAQAEYFETGSVEITGVKVWKYQDRVNDSMGRDWHAWSEASDSYRRHSGTDIDSVPEAILAPALMRIRLVFADNKRTQHDRNRRSGRIDTRVLGKRAWSGDDRLFGKKTLPGRKDYMVLIMLDVSGSTHGVNLKIIKESGMAQAELCSRMGVDFAVYAHTGSPKDDANYDDLWVDLYEVKAAESPWDNTAREALNALQSSVCNLDGHSLEFARKTIEGMSQTEKIILYYSDGAMPAENYSEELEVLTRNIQLCKQNNITLLGVGIRTDSPIRHGLDTVQINDSSEVGAVVAHLERAMLR